MRARACILCITAVRAAARLPRCRSVTATRLLQFNRGRHGRYVRYEKSIITVSFRLLKTEVDAMVGPEITLMLKRSIAPIRALMIAAIINFCMSYNDFCFLHY